MPENMKNNPNAISPDMAVGETSMRLQGNPRQVMAMLNALVEQHGPEATLADVLRDRKAAEAPNFTHIAHADHGLSLEHVEFIMSHPSLSDVPSGQFVLTVLPMPNRLDDLQCGLYGPAVGDGEIDDADCTFEVRGNRQGPSKLIDQPSRPARNMVVIGLKGNVCFTAYGTNASEASPMEPWDAERKFDNGEVDEAEVNQAREFWAVHALSGRQ